MTRIFKIFYFSFFLFFSYIRFVSQNILIGHLLHDEKPVSQVTLEIVPLEGTPSREVLNEKNDFLITLPFQNEYKIFFHHPDYHLSYISVNTRVPDDKMQYRMVTELNMPLYRKEDPDINKDAFKDPVQKFFFNGNNKIVNDTVWLPLFYSKLIKNSDKTIIQHINEPAQVYVNLCALFYLENNKKLPICLYETQILNAQKQVIKKSKTNRFGQMTVTGLNFHQLHELVLITDPKMTGGKDIYLYNNDTTFSKKSQQKEKGKYTWTLTPQEWKKLVCENPEFYIGGKIIYTSRTGKDFYADKTVYLSNRFNTVIKSTRTNRFGMFAFEGLKPDEIYFIGIDTSGIKPGDKFDLLNKEDQFAGRLDSLKGKRRSFRLRTDGSDAHQMLLLDEKDLRMDIKAKIYQKNAGEKLDASIVLMNDKYQPIDSVKVNSVGEFTFKYLKFIKRFFLEIEPENDVSLDQLTQLLLYGKEGEFIKAFSNLKGKKFVYKPIPAEINKMREITLEDPWMELSMNVPSSSNPPAISEKILFEFNQYTILENSKDILNKIAIVLKENPSYHLLITAHTDCIGNPKDNLVLSQKRAEAVKQYLIQKGIDGKRLTTQGFGEEKLLNHCKDGVDCSEMEHAVNRRVEFTIIKK